MQETLALILDFLNFISTPLLVSIALGLIVVGIVRTFYTKGLDEGRNEGVQSAFSISNRQYRRLKREQRE